MSIYSGTRKLRRYLAQIFIRPSLWATAVALTVAVLSGVYLEWQNQLVHQQNSRSAIAEKLGLVRAKLEGTLNSNIQLVRGLVAVIESKPDIDQEYFAQIARELIGSHSHLRNLAAAPNLVIQLMYPIEGNEKAIGLDYRKNDRQRAEALLAVQQREMVLAGPIDLVQGGRGFIGRFPVFLEKPRQNFELWGLVSAVIDVDSLYGEVGLLDESQPIEITLLKSGMNNAKSRVFFGSAETLKQNPVVSTILLPGADWQIAAIPRGGWNSIPPNAWTLRGLILLGGMMVVAPTFLVGCLYEQRRKQALEIKRRQVALEELSQRLKLAVETSKIGIWEFNIDCKKLIWDDRMKELYGLDKNTSEIDYDVWAGFLHPDDVAQVEKDYQSALARCGIYESDFRIVTPSGETRWIRAIGKVRINEKGERYILGVNWDVSSDVQLRSSLLAAKQHAEQRNDALEEARAQMEYNAFHDSLTGLPNRRFLDQHFTTTEATSTPTAILHVDLDRFKHVNDTMGHAAGDSILRHAASVLSKSIRKDDVISRIGGDEFVVMTTSRIGADELAILANDIIENMRKPVLLGSHEVRFGASIGIAVAREGVTESGEQLLIEADIALYRAKRNGRNRYEFFTEALKSEIIRYKKTADEILRGLEAAEFVPYYQPQFCARSLQVVGVEALARWQHPKRGILTPDQFLQTAEELNVVPIIDHSILEQSLQDAAGWRKNSVDIPKISVNVSSSRLNDPQLLETLQNLPIGENRLAFELLESIFLDESNQIVQSNCRKLKSLGIDIEIDDFGSGYASIISLINLSPARLKIDRRLIFPLVRDKSQQQLVASVIQIGHSLGIRVVAEGVETMQHAEILRDLGCDVLQGYAFSGPLSADALLSFVKGQSWRSAA